MKTVFGEKEDEPKRQPNPQQVPQLAGVVEDEVLDADVANGAALVLHHQPVAAQQQEDGHAVVAEVGEQREPHVVAVLQAAQELGVLERVVGVFVLSHDAGQHVAEIVENDTHDGQSLQQVGVLSGQFVFHFALIFL